VCLAAKRTGRLWLSVAVFRGAWRLNLLLRQRRGVPDRHRAAWVADQPVAVRAERQAIDLPARFEVQDLLARLRIPHVHGVGPPRAAGQAFAVRAEGQALGPGPLEDEEFVASLRLPHLDSTVNGLAG